ncbi:hypothetical protein FVEG_15474 [Fusarium verticillioides 7600]|uniref:Major facilitator superfamily (MFS) profile domain-containing protein n=1 Tax=Gibberella moniliformis (strain M3125 / FGSC 7600) TaxID=334819 RepID=W7M580_GIBM7|nr:hypothetical protein FVEG_15474 [Fusarium verticillioides 7600]EWG42654.1 hypothetical protein FVEG_15474 [Fusarium verticillioides 7600]
MVASPELVTPGPSDTVSRQSEKELDQEAPLPATSPNDKTAYKFPEGGLKGWLCVLGSFMGLLASLGIVNSLGSFQAYLETHQLQEYDSGKIGWIFSVYTCLTFFCGVLVGPIFDARGPRSLVLLGSILILATMVSLGFCVEYWHFMLSFGICGGLGTSLVFTPAIAAVSHFFFEKRGIATGIAAGGGAVGGIIVPLTLESLFGKIGFAWATRVVALVWLISLGLACVTITSHLPTKPFSKENILPDLRIFHNIPFLMTTLAVFFVEWGIFIPISYISSYALAHEVPSKLSYQLLAIMNAGSFFGRVLPGYFADRLGRFNVLIITVALCLLSNICLWLPASGSVPLLVIYSCTFGFFSGSGISLTPVCIGQLCATEHYGRYYATAYTVVSLG